VSKKIVYKVEPGMDVREILATTYQMRNFYRQFGDGFFSALDVMNYIQHEQIIRWAKKGTALLDVCCGRGLLLPLLRYQRKDLGSYTGVDIAPKNAKFLEKRVTDGKPIKDDYYPFPVRFIESNVAQMAVSLLPQRFDLLVYTSSIEHMHRDLGMASLRECRAVSKDGAMLYLTCPNTPEGQDGYDTQYAAHVYEWKRSELVTGLTEAGFEIKAEYGLLHNAKVLREELEKVGLDTLYERCSTFIPSKWLGPMLSPLFPKSAKEIGFICQTI